MEVIVDYTEGYPYFIQEYGKIVWDLAPENRPISRRIAQEAQRAVEAKLDESFFQARPTYDQARASVPARDGRARPG